MRRITTIPGDGGGGTKQDPVNAHGSFQLTADSVWCRRRLIRRGHGGLVLRDPRFSPVGQD